MTRAARRLVGPVALAAAASVAFALATRPGPLGFLAFAGALLLHRAVAVAGTRNRSALVTAVAGLGPASVAVTPVAPLHPFGAVGLMVVMAVSFAVVGAVAGGAVPWRGPRTTDAVRIALATASWWAVELAWGSPTLLGAYAMPVLRLGSALAEGPGRLLAASIGTAGLSALILGVGGVGSLVLGLTGERAGTTGRLGRARAAWVLVPLAFGSVLALPSGTRDARPGEVLPLDDPRAPHLRLRLVQHDPTPAGLAAARFSRSAFERWAVPLLASLVDADGRLVVWPEASWPRPIDLRLDSPSHREGSDPPHALTDLVPYDVSLLLGAATLRHDGVRNSVLLVDRGVLAHVADKARPVPLTEGHLLAGSAGTLGSLRGVSFAAAVCWDVVFPSVARAAAYAGAQVLVFVANDAYAGRGPVPALHLRQARLRAIESGRAVVFVQATGPSAAIDASGRIVARLPAGVPGFLDVDVPLAVRGGGA